MSLNPGPRSRERTYVLWSLLAAAVFLLSYTPWALLAALILFSVLMVPVSFVVAIWWWLWVKD